MYTLKDQACLVGVGETAFTRGANKSEFALMLEASLNAIADAGDRKSTRLNSSHIQKSRMPSSA